VLDKVLLVDDDPYLTEGLKRAWRKEPFSVLTAPSAEHALVTLAREDVAVVVSDEHMDGMAGSEFLSRVRAQHPNTVRILLTGNASLDLAVRAINSGEIYRFLTKPCHEQELAATIRQGLRHRALMVESRRLLQKTREQATILEKIEHEAPGVTRVETDENGLAILRDDDSTNLDTLLAQIREELDRNGHSPR
jgi:DNA-binding NtrC family response regulator